MEEKTDLISINYTEEKEDYRHITILIDDFKSDPLYSFLEDAGYGQLILTDNMCSELYIGRTYSVEQAASITNTDAISIRNLLNGANSNIMPHYLQCEKDTKFWHIPTQTVFKIRLVFLFKEKFKSYSWNQIASIGIGKAQPIISEIMNPSEQKALLEKQIAMMEERNKNLEKTIDYIVNGGLQENLEKIISEKFSTVKELNSKLLEDSKNKVEDLKEDYEQFKKESVELIENKQIELDKKMDKSFLEIRYNLNRKRAETEWMENWLSERSFMDRILNKHPNGMEKKVGIEILLKKYEEEDNKANAINKINESSNSNQEIIE